MADLKQRYAQAYGEDSLIAQELLNQYNNESADKQMSFQEYMSNTAHTREVADLVRAGLNPVLSANAGAPSMVGAYANVDSTPISASATKKMQLELQKNDLENQRIMNKYTTDVQAQVGRYSARTSAAATRSAAAQSAAATRAAAATAAGATMYAANQARGSALDVAKQNGKNAVHLAGFNWEHPTSAEGVAARATIYGWNDAKHTGSNSGKSSGGRLPG